MGYVGAVRIQQTVGTADLPIVASGYVICSSAADAETKTVVTSGAGSINALMNGMTLHVMFVNSNTAEDPALKINDLAAVPIRRYETTPPGVTPATSWRAGQIVTLTYTGTAFYMNDSLNTDTTYEKATALSDGLMAKEDKAAMDATGIAIRNACTTSILADSTYAGYPYKLAIYCDFGTEYANGFVHVIFTPEQIQAMKPATVATIDATGGIVTVPIKKQPNGDVTVPTVICWRTPNVRNIS